MNWLQNAWNTTFCFCLCSHPRLRQWEIIFCLNFRGALFVEPKMRNLRENTKCVTQQLPGRIGAFLNLLHSPTTTKQVMSSAFFISTKNVRCSWDDSTPWEEGYFADLWEAENSWNFLLKITNTDNKKAGDVLHVDYFHQKNIHFSWTNCTMHDLRRKIISLKRTPHRTVIGD